MNTSITQSELLILIGGFCFIAIFGFAIQRLLQAIKHGFSIRLQLFFIIFSASLMNTALIGWWALEKIEAKTIFLLKSHGLSTQVLSEFFIDFGPKTSLLLGLLCLLSAILAWAMGKGIAHPIEDLAQRAQRISKGGPRDLEVIQPSGRELRHLNDALQDMQKALEDRQRFESFMADFSHDLKNPVAAIKASIEVLQSGAIDEPKFRDKFLQRIDEASQKLDRILSDFLNLAKLEARGLVIDQKATSIKSLINQLVDSLDGDAHLKQIKIHQDVPNLSIFINGLWMERAIENLLSNAMRYAPKKSNIWVIVEIKNQNLSIQVKDEGIGVDPSIAPYLFERFSQHRKKNGHYYNGVGLGLAIVQKVAQAHGGEVRLLASEKGAHFEIQIPLLLLQSPMGPQLDSVV